MVKFHEDLPDLTLMGWLASVATPVSTFANVNPWGERDEELAIYFATSSGLTVGSAVLFGYEKSKLAYYMGMVATSSAAAPVAMAAALVVNTYYSEKAQYEQVRQIEELESVPWWQKFLWVSGQ